MKHIEQAKRSDILLINSPLTKPKRYPDINKQYVPGRIGITILVSLKIIMRITPQLPERISTTKLKQN